MDHDQTSKPGLEALEEIRELRDKARERFEARIKAIAYTGWAGPIVDVCDTFEACSMWAMACGCRDIDARAMELTRLVLERKARQEDADAREDAD